MDTVDEWLDVKEKPVRNEKKNRFLANSLRHKSMEKEEMKIIR